jgi:hypothetical protein
MPPGSADTNAYMVDGLRRGLAETGYVEGRNVTIEYRWAGGRYDRLPELAAELVRGRVDVIFASGSSAPGLAAKAATSTIPIVFQTGGDPVADGLVPSMNRPGANVTGVSRMTVLLDLKRLELLHEALPKVNTFALLVNRDSPRHGFRDRASSESGALAWTWCGNRQGRLRARAGRSLRCDRARASRRATGEYRSGHGSVETKDCGANPAACASHDVQQPRIYRARWAHELRFQHCRLIPPGRKLCGPHSQRREAGEPSYHEANQIRAGDQSYDR